MTTIHYLEGSLSEDKYEVLAAVEPHFSKFGEAGGCQVFNLDADCIIQHERAGMFASTKGVLNGKIVAIMGSHVFPHIHHKGVMYATSDVLYIDPSLKGRIKILKDLITNHEDMMLYKYQAEYMQICVNANVDIRKLIEQLGYQHSDYVMTRKL